MHPPKRMLLKHESSGHLFDHNRFDAPAEADAAQTQPGSEQRAPVVLMHPPKRMLLKLMPILIYLAITVLMHPPKRMLLKPSKGFNRGDCVF